MNIVELGVAGLAHAFAREALSPVEACDRYLARIERFNPRVVAFLDLDMSGARAAAQASAERWRTGQPLSAVDGVPVGIKANIAVEGLPRHAGIGAYRDRVAEKDAQAVARLRAAGAVILGTLNMHEGALGATTDNPWFGRTQNPHRAGFTAGGSSGGSAAAVAAGLCAAALGSDTMGSVRIPSAYCGVFGHKPARGAISNDGVLLLSPTLDQIGVHARSAEDCAAILAAVSPGSVGTLSDPKPRARLAALEFSGQVDVAPEVADAFAALVQTAQDLGFDVAPCRLAGYDYGRMRRLGLAVVEAEGAAVHRTMLAADPEGFSPAFRKLLAWGAAQPESKIAEARTLIAEAAARVEGALADFDALLAPAAPQTAFAFADEAPANQADFTALANFLGWPACAFPLAATADGLPLSAQVMARDEATVLQAARKLAASCGLPGEFAVPP